MTDEDIKYIKKNYLNLTNKELASKLNTSTTSIIRTLTKFNLSRRKLFKLNNNEILKPINNFSRYEASSHGRFRKISDNTEILQTFTPDGYLSVKLIDDNGKRITLRSNRVIARVFCNNDNPKIKIEVNHIDGVKTNNFSNNLEWVSPSDNQKHAYKNNLRKPITSEKCHLTRHSNDDVRLVCSLLEDGKTSTEIYYATFFSKTFISSIKNRKSRKDISIEYNF